VGLWGDTRIKSADWLEGLGLQDARCERRRHPHYSERHTGQVAASPITYKVDGEQYVSIAAGNSLFTFGLRKQ
jgi:hypothetical protein